VVLVGIITPRREPRNRLKEIPGGIAVLKDGTAGGETVKKFAKNAAS